MASSRPSVLLSCGAVRGAFQGIRPVTVRPSRRRSWAERDSLSKNQYLISYNLHTKLYTFSVRHISPHNSSLTESKILYADLRTCCCATLRYDQVRTAALGRVVALKRRLEEGERAIVNLLREWEDGLATGLDVFAACSAHAHGSIFNEAGEVDCLHTLNGPPRAHPLGHPLAVGALTAEGEREPRAGILVGRALARERHFQITVWDLAPDEKVLEPEAQTRVSVALLVLAPAGRRG